ncbi:hypothetical protein H7X87_02570, partial [Acetobacteraceae bacterium]|nr:hypothetical protein [Candidatus Parcubacteria bacterium]
MKRILPLLTAAFLVTFTIPAAADCNDNQRIARAPFIQQDGRVIAEWVGVGESTIIHHNLDVIARHGHSETMGSTCDPSGAAALNQTLAAVMENDAAGVRFEVAEGQPPVDITFDRDQAQI